jgi:hypothetical protein
LTEPASEEQREEYLRISRWRETERAHMITAMHEMIDEARKRAKSRRSPPGERIRWTRLAGQLIWYKDSILRSMTQEAMERELIVLKQQVLAKKSEEKPPPGYMWFGQPPTKQEPTNKTE